MEKIVMHLYCTYADWHQYMFFNILTHVSVTIMVLRMFLVITCKHVKLGSQWKHHQMWKIEICQISLKRYL